MSASGTSSLPFWLLPGHAFPSFRPAFLASQPGCGANRASRTHTRTSATIALPSLARHRDSASAISDWRVTVCRYRRRPRMKAVRSHEASRVQGQDPDKYLCTPERRLWPMLGEGKSRASICDPASHTATIAWRCAENHSSVEPAGRCREVRCNGRKVLHTVHCRAFVCNDICTSGPKMSRISDCATRSE